VPKRQARKIVSDPHRVAARAAAKPRVSYPPELPVSQRADDIAAAIREHPVVIVSGETGSGKTTQLPKICLAAGRGERGLIGHTQPRRIAARAVAARIAHELGTPLGEAVGYKVRFTDRTRPDAYVKLMTDGILLAETQADPDLARYDTIIIDEAHERSLNIDFLLGYLKRLLERRPDLKVIVTSATIDAARFAAHFAHDGRPAPVITVSGRTYPVEIVYRPLHSRDDEADDEEELEEAIASAAEDLWREGPGDMLVFLPGEREIRETADVLRRALARRPYAGSVEILPLYARLTVDEQQRVFSASRGRRVVLATNVAETSLTVPGIRYVIDSGLARVKRYSVRNKTTLLVIEKIAQAAANQRAGRSGRVQNGLCVRLYDADDFAARPAYTDPEILRSSLAAVILRMAALRLGDVAAFPFLDPPSPRAIADGYQLLQELGAVDDERNLTPLGGELAKLPVDPRVGRIVLAARDNGCLAEGLVIASALSVPDPRERPLERAQAADQAHLRFRDPRSDFLSLLLLWEFFDSPAQKALSHRKRVDACRAHFVSFLRLTEWRDVHAQLVAVLTEAGWKVDATLPAAIDAARYEAIHRALLAGLLGNIGLKSDPPAVRGAAKAQASDDRRTGEYDGARGIRFFLHPGSGLAKKGPKWVVAAELTQTTRLFARCAARVEPEWIEAVAGNRVTRDWFDAHWDKARGEVVASERVQLYGLTLVPRRLVAYGPIAPVPARDVFIREALVAGELGIDAPFAAHNRALVAEVAELEHKARRADVLVDDEAIAAFYAERIPDGVHSRATFEQWRRHDERGHPKRLFLTREALMRHAAVTVTEALFPETMAIAGAQLPLKYRFAPGHPLDGLTLTVPLALLNQVDEATLSWLVPGMIRDKVTLYLKSLPKAWRNRLIPLPDTVTAFLEATPEHDVALVDALRAFVQQRLGDAPPAAAFHDVDLPPHVAVNVRVVDASGQELGMDRDIATLRARLSDAARLEFASEGPAFERRGMRQWDFGELPETLAMRRDGQRRTGYPALVGEPDGVALMLLDTREAALAATRDGVVRLIGFELDAGLARTLEAAPAWTSIGMALRAVVPLDRLHDDLRAAVRDRAYVGDDPLPRDRDAFTAQVKRARARLPAVIDSGVKLLAAIAAEHHALSQRIAALPASQRMFATEVKALRDALVHPGFLAMTPWPQLGHLPRYLQALGRRIERYPQNTERDQRHAAQVATWWARYNERAGAERRAGGVSPALDAFRWLLEELRVSLFAQELRTSVPVSLKRVDKAWQELSRAGQASRRG